MKHSATTDLVRACVWQVKLATATNVLMMALIVLAVVGGPRFGPNAGTLLPLLAMAAWVMLSLRGVRAGRDAAATPASIAAGQFDLAEQQLDDAMRTFSLMRAPKLLCLHHLAMLRQAQGRWAESALTCRALLRQRLGKLQLLETAAGLMLADASLETGDLATARAEIGRLRTAVRRTGGLLESLKLMAIEVELLSREGRHAEAIANLRSRVELAEILPPVLCARTIGYLARSAQAAGQGAWGVHLREKFDLLANAQVVRNRPELAELVRAPV